MTDNQDRQFRLGAIVREEYQELAMLLPGLEDRLNEAVNLKYYTDQFDGIDYSPILIPADDNSIREECLFDNDNREIRLIDRIETSHLSDRSFTALISNGFSEDLVKHSVVSEELIEAVLEILHPVAKSSNSVLLFQHKIKFFH